MKKISETYGLKVFTDTGEYFGDIEDVLLTMNKISGWKIRATKGSYLNKLVGDAKGVVIPHHLIKSMGDVVIISKAAIPSRKEEAVSEEPAVE